MAKTKPQEQPDEKPGTDILDYLAVRRLPSDSQLPSIINVPDGAYIAVALLAVAAVVAHGWAALPMWVALIPMVLLLAGFAMKSVFGGLMLYEGWQRWRSQRRRGGGLL
jgi:hypothetical protein